MDVILPQVQEAKEHKNRGYISGHWPRFNIGMELMDKYIPFTKGFKVVELGSKLPYFTCLLPEKYGAEVHIQSIETVPQVIGPFIFSKCNLCTDDLGENKWDVAITTEIWEHLACDLYKLRENVLRSIKPGGFWLSSFPLGGVNAKDYGKRLEIDVNICQTGHLREFTDKTASEFMDIDNIKILEHKTAVCPAYGRPIKTYLSQLKL